MTSPFDQSRYQVRFEWGTSGLERVAAAEIVVVIDVLRLGGLVVERIESGQDAPWDAAAQAAVHGESAGAAVIERAARLTPAPVIVLGTLRNASAVADAVLAEQQHRGGRTSTAIVACGGRSAHGEVPRFAVEDLLGAGAVIDALGTRGIDHTSPEAAAACEAFRGLRGAVRHLLTASGSGQELIDRGARDAVLAAGVVDASASVPILREGVFVAL